MSIPFPPDRGKDVTTVPFAGHCQRFTGALPSFAARFLLFFRPPEEAADLLPDVFPRDLDGDFDGVLEAVPGARELWLWLTEGADRVFFSVPCDALDERWVETVRGGCVSRSA